MQYILSLVLIILPVSILAGDFDREIIRTGNVKTGSGLKYKDAVIHLDGCSAVCINPKGIYLTANHCEFKVGQSYKTNVDGLYLECVVNNKVFDGVTVLVETNNQVSRPYIPVSYEAPKPGDKVYAIGYPAGKFSYHEAMVSRISVGSKDNNTYYTINQRLFEGHSGGPLISDDDKLLGILSTRTLLSSEFKRGVPIPAESNFLGLPVIRAALGQINTQGNRQSKPTIVVLSLKGCAPCERFEGDLRRGAFQNHNYNFVITKWNGPDLGWSNPEYAMAYKNQFGAYPQAYPTFWVVGTKRTCTQYNGPTSLLGFIRDSVRFIAGLIIGNENEQNRKIPSLPDAPKIVPEDSGLAQEIKDKVDELERTIGQLKDNQTKDNKENSTRIQDVLGKLQTLFDRFEKIKEVEGKVESSVEAYKEIRTKIDFVLTLLNESKKEDTQGVNVIELITQLKEMRERVQRVEESKVTQVSEEKEDSSSGLGTILTLANIGKYFGPIGLAGGAGLGGLYWFLRRRKNKKKPQQTNPIPLPPISNVPQLNPVSSECSIGERLLDRLNQMEQRYQTPPKTDDKTPKEPDLKNKYVPYETEKFKEAVAYAHEQCAKRYPGAVGTLEYLDKVVDQYLNQENAMEK